MYAIQQQALGSIQWTIIASGLKETSYTITTLSKSVRYAFRVLTITSKAFSKPSTPTEPVQLLDRGAIMSFFVCQSVQINLFIKYSLGEHMHFCIGSYLQEAPVIMDKPEIVYVIENQSVSITITLNHVNAAVIWKRYLGCQVCQCQ